MHFILVGIGGAFGGVARYNLGKMLTKKNSFPIATFFINITGAFLLGIVASLNAGNNIYLLLGDGFLGAYTTFSTFMFESFNLYKDNKRLNALFYILSSIFLGILGYFIGFILGNMLNNGLL
ncbi:MAG: fluoride efflux transporter CrcB [Bacillota bacterium]|nr:fluoride efflux transporter CrcB [Bacillota bacterium]